MHIEDDEPRHILQAHQHRVRSVAWAPDGRHLASASDDTTIQVWDVLDEHHLHTLNEHSGYVYAVAWSPDGEMIASASDDATLWVWQVVYHTSDA
jgi:WD40 repeat protein